MPNNFLVDKERMLFLSPMKIDRQYTQGSRLRRSQRVGWSFLSSCYQEDIDGRGRWKEG